MADLTIGTSFACDSGCGRDQISSYTRTTKGGSHRLSLLKDDAADEQGKSR